MTTDKQVLAGLQAAIDKAGGKGRLMRAIGLTPGAINYWRKGVPIERVLEVEKATGVPRHILRPDYYPAEYVHSVPIVYSYVNRPNVVVSSTNVKPDEPLK